MEKFVINEAFLQQVETLEVMLKNSTAGLFGGNHTSKTFGSSTEFKDYRDYQAGDDITKIDWNAYARFDKFYLKLYSDERQVHTKIYIDASQSMAFDKSKKAEYALQIAAILAYISIAQMDKVSIYYIQNNQVHEVITGMLGKDSYYSSIGKLNEIEFKDNSFISESILPTRVGYGDGMSVIISDFLTDNDYERAIDYLVEKKRDVLCIQVLDKEELVPTVRGKVHFYDCEDTKNEYRKNINRDIIKAYKQALEYVINRIKNYCQTRNADYMLASTSDSVMELFLRNMAEIGVLK